VTPKKCEFCIDECITFVCGIKISKVCPFLHISTKEFLGSE
jgi:hypothetical protein